MTGYISMARQGWQELVNAIIRPPRAEYDLDDLGPSTFQGFGKSFRRTDFVLVNARGLTLQCSHWEPEGDRPAERLPCVIYLHGNSSARPEAVPQLSLVLSLGATLCCFDAAGSGMSGGAYVSLGYFERDDLGLVVEHLRASGRVGAIALWGRSMGAATALLHGDRDPGIAAMVLDSAFADLTQLAEEMVERGRQQGLAVPPFVAKILLRFIRSAVSSKAGFDIKDLCPLEHADRTFIPSLFIHARGDEFIRPSHSQQLHDAYAGDKNIVLVEGDHNSARPRFLYHSVYIFLQTYLQVPEGWALVDCGPDISVTTPPWCRPLGMGSASSPNPTPSAAYFLNGDRHEEDQVKASLVRLIGRSRTTGSSPPSVRRRPSPPSSAAYSRTAQTAAALNANEDNASRESITSTDTSRADIDRPACTTEVDALTAAEANMKTGQRQASLGELQVEEFESGSIVSTNGYSSEPWICPTCTLVNEPFLKYCAVCGNDPLGPAT